MSPCHFSGRGLSAFARKPSFSALIESSPFFGPLACEVMKRYAAGETIEPWVKVEDRIFTTENAAEHIGEAY